MSAGRCLIGDDMGLGKTIQAIAAAELMARFFHIEKVLIISPTSLKYQWKAEIEKFTDRTATVIEGLTPGAGNISAEDTLYKIINYELVYRDLEIMPWWPDLIILDEAQRIKNWKTRTAKPSKRLDSTFALVLTGTPMENRIEELHSIMEFVDRRHLGPCTVLSTITRSGTKTARSSDIKICRSDPGTSETGHDPAQERGGAETAPGEDRQNIFVPMTREQRTCTRSSMRSWSRSWPSGGVTNSLARRTSGV